MDGLKHSGYPKPRMRGSPKERKKKPARCSHCRTQFAGTGPHLIRLLYDAGWRVRFQDGQLPTLLLCPDCQLI